MPDQYADPLQVAVSLIEEAKNVSPPPWVAMKRAAALAEGYVRLAAEVAELRDSLKRFERIASAIDASWDAGGDRWWVALNDLRLMAPASHAAAAQAVRDAINREVG